MDFTGRSGTLLGPLTTVWSMPDSCSVHVRLCESCHEGFRGQQCVSGEPQDHTTCWPPTTRLSRPPTHPFVGWGFYSPGLECPSGYTTACTARYNGRPDWEIEFSLIPGETAVGCCPEGFMCTNRNGNTCIATDTELALATGFCSGSQVANIGQTTFPASVEVTTTITDDGGTAVETFVQDMVFLAPMFQLNFQSSDLESLSSSTASPSSASTSTGPRSTDSSSTSSDPLATTGSGQEEQSGGNAGLSTGAIAGISVGAALGGILLGMLAIILFIRNKRKKEGSTTPTSEWQQTAPAGGPPSNFATYKYASELPSAGPDRSELPESWHDRFELPVDGGAGYQQNSAHPSSTYQQQSWAGHQSVQLTPQSGHPSHYDH
ncbi:hypothetical protein C7999DRAFT_33488 [Corynascus novoguineensis]|uniref:Uncharacterized protein n=1 Tax=Corynascus novoguineensis TaxID=1126955 RepID=A0AAN7HHT8_9PEZI|nr:hypothetical protein C7999DRAFT_33488 [Corynascus novoguineensis]